MVSMPERRWACCSAEPGGLGVVGREAGIGVTDRERTALSLISFASGERVRGDRDIERAGTHFLTSRVSRTCLRMGWDGSGRRESVTTWRDKMG